MKFLRSTRARAVLSLGVVLALGSTGTMAYWTDSATISGVTFTSGTLDLAVNNNTGGTGSDGSTVGTGGSTAQTSLSMTAMAPGNTSAQLLTIKNPGTAPLKWTAAGGLTGTNAAAFAAGGPSSSSALRISVFSFAGAAAKTGTGNSVTCSGGTALASSVQLTTNTSGSIVSTGQPVTPAGGLAAGGSVNLCVQVDFDSAASTSLQSLTVNGVLTFSATSNVS
ncbi:SipW-dependent-type signal peptide-containing protein [Aeromicrobium sp.]|uniref:SipW-dependent-type signal peptide-containing protein n=1 Tax=Aeromicrobium sp. TaxID=1871063 RepID=UPI003C5C50DB